MSPMASRTRGNERYRFLNPPTLSPRAAMSRCVARMSGGRLTCGWARKKINTSIGIFDFFLPCLRGFLLIRESQCVHGAHVSRTGEESLSMLWYTK